MDTLGNTGNSLWQQWTLRVIGWQQLIGVPRGVMGNSTCGALQLKLFCTKWATGGNSKRGYYRQLRQRNGYGNKQWIQALRYNLKAVAWATMQVQSN